MPQKNTLLAAAIIMLVLILGWNLFLFQQTDKKTLWNYLFNLFYGFIFLGGGIIGVIGANKMSLESTIGKALFFLGMGLIYYAIGQCIWVYFNLIIQIEIPYPSLADIFFLLFIPFIGIGVAYIIRMFLLNVGRRLIIESVLILFVSGILIFVFLAKPDISHNLPTLTRFFNIAYPLGDTILLSLAFVVLRVSGGKIYAGIRYIILALLLQVSADITFAYRTTNNSYWNGDISDLLFAFSSLAFAIGIITMLSDFTPLSQRSKVDSLPSVPQKN